MDLLEVRKAKAEKVQEMRSILANETLTDENAKTLEQLKGEIEKLDKRASDLQFLQEQERRTLDKPFTQLQEGLTVVGAIQAQLTGAGGKYAEYSKEQEQRTGRKAKGVYVPFSAFETRDFAQFEGVQTTKTTGDAIIPAYMLPDQYISPLRNSLLMRSMGLTVLSGVRGGGVAIPKHRSGMTAGWVNENEALTPSGMTFESVTMTPKHVGAITELSRQLIQQATPSINALVSDELSWVMSEAVDRALLQGSGDKDPIGVLTAITADQSVPKTWADVLDWFNTLDTRNVRNYKWLTSPSLLNSLRKIEKEKGTGNYLADATSIGGVSASITNQVPEGTLILADWSQMILGTYADVDILVNPYAETAYARGNVQIRAFMTLGTTIRHDEAFLIAKTGA